MAAIFVFFLSSYILPPPPFRDNGDSNDHFYVQEEVGQLFLVLVKDFYGLY